MPYPRPKGQGGESLEGVGHNRSRKSTTFFPTGKILLLTASDFLELQCPWLSGHLPIICFIAGSSATNMYPTGLAMPTTEYVPNA